MNKKSTIPVPTKAYISETKIINHKLKPYSGLALTCLNIPADSYCFAFFMSFIRCLLYTRVGSGSLQLERSMSSVHPGGADDTSGKKSDTLQKMISGNVTLCLAFRIGTSFQMGNPLSYEHEPHPSCDEGTRCRSARQHPQFRL